MKCEAKLIGYTQPCITTPAANPEELVAFCARVSSERDYTTRSEDFEGLLRYCIKNKHWSVFEMVNAVVEVKAPRDITRQLLRHRSFSFQEFSQRYSDEIEFTEREIRRQDDKNRQKSYKDAEMDEWGWDLDIKDIISKTKDLYKDWRNAKGAKECVRVILPEGLTMSTLYVNGTLRSWLHYVSLREGNGTQEEHRLLAQAIARALEPIFPVTLGLKNEVDSEST